MFVAAATGLLCTAFIIEPVKKILGTANTFMFAQALFACSQTLTILTPPWPLVLVACFLMGVGAATPIALANVFVSNFENGTALMGLMHGCYCIGGEFRSSG